MKKFVLRFFTIVALVAVALFSTGTTTPLDLVSQGNYVEAASAQFPDAKIRLLYSSGSGCVWGKIQDVPVGLATGRHHATVWVERMAGDGSVQRLGWTYNQAQYASVYTSSFNTIGSAAARVCGATAMTNIWSSNPYNAMDTVGSGCSQWFWPGMLWQGMYMGQRGFDCLSSQNNRYVFCMQYDGNLVLYSSGRAVWATNTFKTASKLWMQNDGNLVIYDYYGNPVWSTGTYRYPGTKLVVQNDGNVVLYSPYNGAVWSSNTMGR
jgi:hypothetical protein